jgi:hypothetical protein
MFGNRRRKDEGAHMGEKGWCPKCWTRKVKGGMNGTCGRQACMDMAANDQGHHGERGRTAQGEIVTVRGSSKKYKVMRDLHVKGTPCYVLKPLGGGANITRPIDETKMH